MYSVRGHSQSTQKQQPSQLIHTEAVATSTQIRLHLENPFSLLRKCMHVYCHQAECCIYMSGLHLGGGGAQGGIRPPFVASCPPKFFSGFTCSTVHTFKRATLSSTFCPPHHPFSKCNPACTCTYVNVRLNCMYITLWVHIPPEAAIYMYIVIALEFYVALTVNFSF